MSHAILEFINILVLIGCIRTGPEALHHPIRTSSDFYRTCTGRQFSGLAKVNSASQVRVRNTALAVMLAGWSPTLWLYKAIAVPHYVPIPMTV